MSPLKLNGSTSGFVALDAPAAAGSNTLVLPTGNGSNGQVLTTNGSGTLSWSTVTSSQWTTTGSDIYYTTGKVLVGTSSTRTLSGVNAQIQLEGTSEDTASQSFIINTNTTGGVNVTLGKTRGTSIGGTTVVNNGDDIGTIRFSGSDGSSLLAAALIRGAVDGTPGTNDMPGRLVFSTTADGASSPTERMKIDNKGFLKATNSGSYYGSTSSYHEFRSNALEPALLVSHHGTSGNQFGLYIATANDQNDTARYFLTCVGGGTERATIRSNGGLANYSANNVNLSDINTKKDISPAAGTWDCIKEWEIVNYRYKDQPDDADLNLGVIAQQVAESCPEVITVFEEAKDDQPEKLGVKEQQMMWMAIKALQEAQARIETLEANNAALEARLSALEVTP